jgi:hypothetical protein
MLFPYKNDNIKDHVCMDNMIFIMVRQVFSNIRTFKDRCCESGHRPIKVFSV